MANQSEDAGVIQAVMERFNEQRLPRALDLKEKVDRGEVLADYDISFLEEILGEIRAANPLIERHPELQPLVVKVMGLYKEIAEKAAANARQ